MSRRMLLSRVIQLFVLAVFPSLFTFIFLPLFLFLCRFFLIFLPPFFSLRLSLFALLSYSALRLYPFLPFFLSFSIPLSFYRFASSLSLTASFVFLLHFLSPRAFLSFPLPLILPAISPHPLFLSVGPFSSILVSPCHPIYPSFYKSSFPSLSCLFFYPFVFIPPCHLPHVSLPIPLSAFLPATFSLPPFLSFRQYSSLSSLLCPLFYPVHIYPHHLFSLLPNPSLSPLLSLRLYLSLPPLPCLPSYPFFLSFLSSRSFFPSLPSPPFHADILHPPHV